MLEWELLILKQLQKEYDFILWERKLKLRPITLLLTDTKSYWGQFDPLTRTLNLSRNLIWNCTWTHVLGVLRHEVAHQVVEDVFKTTASSTSKSQPDPISSEETPHGSLFIKACDWVGVPPQFRKASLNLQNLNDLDDSQHALDPSFQPLLKKVQKLLALAESNNEHEAFLAMQKVRELYARHNLEHLQSMHDKKYMQKVIVYSKKKMPLWLQRILTLLCEHFFVKVITLKQFNARDLMEYSAFEILGTPENVLMAEYVYFFLLQKLEELTHHAIKNKICLNKITSKNSYRLGILEGFHARLNTAKTYEKPNLKNAAHSEVVTQELVNKALIAFEKDQGLGQFVQNMHPRLRQRTQTRTSLDASAYQAGNLEGKNLNLHKPIVQNNNSSEKLFIGR